jgi:HSP20 family protein
MNGLARTNGAARPTTGSMLPLRVAFDRLFENAFTSAFGPLDGSGGGASAGIPTNIWETDGAYHIALLVPGARPDDVEITALGNTITVAGAYELTQPEGVKMVWQEFGPSQFRRQIGLPTEVDSEHIEAAYQNGVLMLTVPKAEHAKPRQIKVQTV